MSAQDKIERILKQIHVLFAKGQTYMGDPDLVIVDKKEIFTILEELNLAIYEIMDQYEVTSQSRELAQRRSEKKGEELVARVTRQTEDVYAASLIYTDDALSKVNRLMAEALTASQSIWRQLCLDVEQEQRKIKEDQLELREQLQDFKDSDKYLNIIEECNRQREKDEQQANAPQASIKKIQNQAKHYPMKVVPEIKINPAYFERRGLNPDGTKMTPENVDTGNSSENDLAVSTAGAKQINDPEVIDLSTDWIDADPPSTRVNNTESEEKESFVMPEIKVDLDAEYFKWQEENLNGEQEQEEWESTSPKRERWTLFGKLRGQS